MASWWKAGWAGLGATLSLLAGCAAMGPSVEEQNLSRATYDLAGEAFRQGKYRQALEQVEKALAADAGNAEAAYLGGVVLLGFCAGDEQSPDCRYERAEQLFRQAVEADPQMGDAKNALGVTLVHLQRPLEAIEILQPLANDIIYRSPEKAWGNLGWAHLRAGQPDEAIGALKRAVAAQPLFCVGHFRLGLAYEKKGDFAAARRAFTRALDTEESSCKRLQVAFWGRARVLLRLGKTAEVRQDLEQCRNLARSTETGRRCTQKLQALK